MNLFHFDFNYRYLQQDNFQNNNGNSKEYQNMVCYRYTLMGGASLTYADPQDNSKSITLILVIYGGNDTPLSSTCVNEKIGEQGPGKLCFLIMILTKFDTRFRRESILCKIFSRFC